MPQKQPRSNRPLNILQALALAAAGPVYAVLVDLLAKLVAQF